MAEITIDELIERARLESGLRNNAYYDATQILKYLNAGGSELHDLFVTTNEKYLISEFDFTTTGPSDSIVDLPDDFQQGHSLDIYPSTYDGVVQTNAQTRTVRYLNNWLNRNSFGNGVFTIGGRDPVYTFLGNQLRFYPPQAVPAAQFKLYYTPTWTPLAAEVSSDFEIDASDNPTNHAGNLEWVLANLDATDAMVGGALTLTFEAPNEAFNGTYTISEVLSPTAVVTTTAMPGGSFTNPAVGTANVTYQPAGTRSTLPNVMASWSEYLVVYAAMAINIDRQRPIGELERKLERLKARVASVLGTRQEEPEQPPLTRGAGGGFGFGWGWGGDF